MKSALKLGQSRSGGLIISQKQGKKKKYFNLKTLCLS